MGYDSGASSWRGFFLRTTAALPRAFMVSSVSEALRTACLKDCCLEVCQSCLLTLKIISIIDNWDPERFSVCADLFIGVKQAPIVWQKFQPWCIKSHFSSFLFTVRVGITFISSRTWPDCTLLFIAAGISCFWDLHTFFSDIVSRPWLWNLTTVLINLKCFHEKVRFFTILGINHT